MFNFWFYLGLYMCVGYLVVQFTAAFGETNLKGIQLFFIMTVWPVILLAVVYHMITGTGEKE